MKKIDSKLPPLNTQEKESVLLFLLENSKDQVLSFLKRGWDPNSSFSDLSLFYNTPIKHGSFSDKNKKSDVQLYFEKRQNHSSWSPLTICLFMGYFELANVLIEWGADVNKSVISPDFSKGPNKPQSNNIYPPLFILSLVFSENLRKKERKEFIKLIDNVISKSLIPIDELDPARPRFLLFRTITSRCIPLFERIAPIARELKEMEDISTKSISTESPIEYLIRQRNSFGKQTPKIENETRQLFKIALENNAYLSDECIKSITEDKDGLLPIWIDFNRGKLNEAIPLIPEGHLNKSKSRI